MKHEEILIKEGIKLHKIKTNKFKTNIVSVFLTTKLDRNTITKNALIPALLMRGSKNMQTNEKINIELEGMYGAILDIGVDKIGNNQVVKIYIETIADDLAFECDEEILKKSMEKILEIIFEPYLEDGYFKEEYLTQEKELLKTKIEAKIDNKSKYAIDRCIEEMYENKNYGLYKIGYVEDIEDIDRENIKKQYNDLINNSKIDIIISGDFDENIVNEIKENTNIKKLKARDPIYHEITDLNKEFEKEKVIIEKREVSQGKLILGLDVKLESDEERYITSVFNSILGGSANSKMFQNVREKEHLAYVASSSYIRQKNNILIIAGIEISNYDLALEIIKKQLEDMKNGEFTNEDIENAKKSLTSVIKTIPDEQDSEIAYIFSQELYKQKVSVEEYLMKIENVRKEDIVKIAKNISINTIYFLRD